MAPDSAPTLPVTSPSDLNVNEFRPLPAPAELCAAVPATATQLQFVGEIRDAIRRILRGADPRLLVVVGPCSVHDVGAAREYAARLAPLAHELDDHLLIVMRAYFEKPRTNGGWKGLLSDPHLDGSGDAASGLRLARVLLRDLLELRLPTATEFLDPLGAHYLGDLICWSAIGARTTESQPHRQLASGLPMPVGFKNSTSGAIEPAIHAIQSAAHPHTFLGLTPRGAPAAVRTRGNPDGHLVLRGGATGANYDSVHVARAAADLAKAGLRRAIFVDCSHDNSGRVPQRQPEVAREVVRQICAGNRSLVGLMLESNLHAGHQSLKAGRDQLRYGVSITDACLGWQATEDCLRETHAALADRFGSAATHLPPATAEAVA